LALHLFSNRKQKVQDIKSLKDEELAAFYYKNSDMDYLGELFTRYTHLVFGACIKYLRDEQESEDMTMLIFEKLADELNKSEVRYFKSWLYTLTKNQCLMHLRHNKSWERNKEAILLELGTEVMEMPEDLHLVPGDNGMELVNGLELAMTHLNEPQRRCIELFYLREKSYKDVAEETGYSMNEVKSHVQNGKRNLKILLEKNRKHES
jgi:RNA polymerase sigma-70 factor (ECF subfamily)